MKNESRTGQIGFEPAREEFLQIDESYQYAVVRAKMPCDLETPVSAFIKLRDGSPCFLLESAEKSEQWGRFSILGFRPLKVFTATGGTLEISENGEPGRSQGNPVSQVFEEIAGDEMFVTGDELPFVGGSVGFFGYDVMEHLEKVDFNSEASGFPELMFMTPGLTLIFDHMKSVVHIVVTCKLASQRNEREKSYEDAVAIIEDTKRKLYGALPPTTDIPVPGSDCDDFESVRANMSQDEFEKLVLESKERIFAGDAFQIVLSQRFEVSYSEDPLRIYRSLRMHNPSPYMFFLDFPSVKLIGSSPEPMVARRGNRAIIRPIAGTRKRGTSENEDLELEKDLIVDPKERAEHVMLVDLARNDLGRVCEAGSIEMTKLMEIERYSQVMHMVSQVEGNLKSEAGNFDLFKASFPAGTVSGAPKIMACRIIDGLEGERRGPYAGAVGYISCTGDMDLCIAIRTIVLDDEKAYVQAGAGIVADSVPASEYEETRNKARALIRALKAVT